MSPLGISAARTASLPAVLALLLLAVAAPFAIRGRGAAPPAPREAPAHPNVLLFSIDTLRADHLGCYGYARDTSPNLDALADRSLRFTEAFAPAPYTLPSHVAMLTGIHPHALGIENRRSAIPAETRLLAELLSEAGYRSAAFVDSMPRGFVGGSRGFARGFDEYTHMPERAKRGYRYDMAATADAAARWLAGRADDRPFFLFLHTKSVHTLPSRAGGKNPMHFPYDKPEPYRSRFLSDAAAGLSWSEPKLGSGVDYLRALNERLASGEISPADIPRERVD
ncbi:MAG: sulfatase-like hydrolase/transferase, partial [Deltaproteobacteria bacterium]